MENRFFNPTNTTQFSASWEERIVLLVGLKKPTFEALCMYVAPRIYTKVCGTVGLHI